MSPFSSNNVASLQTLIMDISSIGPRMMRRVVGVAVEVVV